MPYRSFARYLAPLALGAAFVVLVVAYVASFGGDDPPATPGAPSGNAATTATGAGTTATGTTGTTTATTAGDADDDVPGRTYTVQPGDILSTIAEEQGVTVERILELNPDIDPQSLQAGDELDLGP